VGLEPDFITVGKSVAGGVPLACYGMTNELAELFAPPDQPWVSGGEAVGEIATGGTLLVTLCRWRRERPRWS
jgi:glutamate-1-semialdehyde aminotransferase